MVEAAAKPCSECQRLQAQLEEQRARLEQQRTQLEAQGVLLEQLQAAVVRLEEQLAAARKDSSTSSKPPSSDIVKPPPPPPPPGQDKRKRGGQPGHPKHERALFPQDQVNDFFVHTLSGCPCCGGPLHLNGGFAKVVQQVDLEPAKLTIEQHTCPEYWCVHCEKSYKADLPLHIVKGGLVGPRLTTLIAFLKGFCHASYSTIRKYLRDVIGVTISRGQLKKVIGKVSEALEGPYQELLEALPAEAVLNVDETGHKDNGKRMWTWCFRASLYTLFKIDPYRSADVLIKVLGKEFDGVLGCDCFSAYRRYMREFDVTLQFCLAHLIRDVKFLMKLPGKKEQAYGTRLRDALRTLFGVIHQREQMPAVQFQKRLEAARDFVLGVAQQDVPGSRHAQALAKRMAKHGVSYFTFVTTPGVQPTNNLAEQAIRFVVIDRHITQGTRSEGGQRWCERIWTVIATCAGQGDRSVFDYLYAAVKAYFGGGAAPSLLPVG
jgi:transposase